MKTVTSKLARVGPARLPIWGPKDSYLPNDGWRQLEMRIGCNLTFKIFLLHSSFAHYFIVDFLLFLLLSFSLILWISNQDQSVWCKLMNTTTIRSEVMHMITHVTVISWKQEQASSHDRLNLTILHCLLDRVQEFMWKFESNNDKSLGNKFTRLG